MPKRHPPEFRRKVLDLVAAGRPVAKIAADLDISDRTIYTWRRQDLIDTGQLPGLTSADNAELAIHRRAAGLLKDPSGPRGSGTAAGRRYYLGTHWARRADEGR